MLHRAETGNMGVPERKLLNVVEIKVLRNAWSNMEGQNKKLSKKS